MFAVLDVCLDKGAGYTMWMLAQITLTIQW